MGTLLNQLAAMAKSTTVGTNELAGTPLLNQILQGIDNAPSIEPQPDAMPHVENAPLTTEQIAWGDASGLNIDQTEKYFREVEPLPDRDERALALQKLQAEQQPTDALELKVLEKKRQEAANNAAMPALQEYAKRDIQQLEKTAEARGLKERKDREREEAARKAETLDVVPPATGLDLFGSDPK